MSDKKAFQDLIKAQKEFEPAKKNSNNTFHKSKYADLSACIDAVLSALNNNNFSLIQKTHECENGVAVETLLIHESGDIISSGILKVPAIKHDPQGYGSALTYARRYSLMAVCGIAPEDDDGNAASKEYINTQNNKQNNLQNKVEDIKNIAKEKEKLKSQDISEQEKIDILNSAGESAIKGIESLRSWYRLQSDKCKEFLKNNKDFDIIQELAKTIDSQTI